MVGYAEKRSNVGWVERVSAKPIKCLNLWEDLVADYPIYELSQAIGQFYHRFDSAPES